MSELQVEILNGLQGDPAVYAFISNSGEALLLDLGMIDSLPQRDLMKVRHVFVSHTHMDHFMGFDRWLRVNIPHRRLLRIWGPAPFFERVQAKLRSYIWNLVEPEQIRFEVHEVRPDGSVPVALLTNTDGFALHVRESEASSAALCTLHDGSMVSCVGLNHNGIASLAYKIRSPDKLRFLHDQLPSMGLTSGPWISELQRRIKHNEMQEPFTACGRVFVIAELAAQVLRAEPGESLIYLTDLSFDRINVQRLQDAFSSSTRMICESSFLDSDRPRAVAKAHLTTRQAALVACALEVADLQIFHVSTIYGQGAQDSVEEAQRFFAEYSGLNALGKVKVLDAEFRAVETLRNQ